MRISSKEYRSWTLEQWCQHVESLGVSTLTQWSVAARSPYNHAVTLGLQRDIARALGWLPPLAQGEMKTMSDERPNGRRKATRLSADPAAVWQQYQN